MKKVFSITLIIVSTLLVSCSSGSSDREIQINNIWSRSSPGAAQNGVIYMEINNNTGQDDQLMSAESTACTAVELHETEMDGNDVMMMRQVTDGIDLPAGQLVEFKVGGLHVMCIEKLVDFEAGEKFSLTLNFANADDIAVTVEVRDDATQDMESDHSNMEGMDEEGSESKEMNDE